MVFRVKVFKTRMCIILLSGWSMSGKDTVGQFLIDHYGFQRLAVADIMKDVVHQSYSIPYELLHTQEGKDTSVTIRTTDGNKTCTVRDLIIDYAMSKRKENPDHWINLLIDSVRDDINTFSRYVVTDFRFPNECARIMEEFPDQQVRTVRVNRLNEPRILSSKSENVLDSFDFDYVIDNTRDLLHLKNEIVKMINYFDLSLEAASDFAASLLPPEDLADDSKIGVSTV